MTKDKIISKQARKIIEQKKKFKLVSKRLDIIHNNFVAIGAPLNDNILKFNAAQMKWATQVNQTVEQAIDILKYR